MMTEAILRGTALDRRALLQSLALGAGTGALALGRPDKAAALADTAGGLAYQTAVKDAYEQCRGITAGKNADYIPALAKVPSGLFGVTLVTVCGKVFSYGDTAVPFSIQSISKVFTLAQVLQESGEKAVEDSVGVDATGQKFNSIVAIEQYRGREMNPLVNPGAIAMTGTVKGANAEAVWRSITAMHNACAGRELGLEQEVYKSESDTNQRNRAIGMLMSAYERFPGDPAQAVDLYTRQCSISVTSRDLGVMAATLAAGGRNPVTGVQAIGRDHVPGILAIMATAGLYDDSGQWLFHTGLPAKSGVGGGLIAVSPGRFGIGTFAPPLDEAGNSVKGQAAITMICKSVRGNPYDPPSVPC
jgi:glutaminase